MSAIGHGCLSVICLTSTVYFILNYTIHHYKGTLILCSIVDTPSNSSGIA